MSVRPDGTIRAWAPGTTDACPFEPSGRASAALAGFVGRAVRAAPMLGQEVYGGGTFDGFFAAYSASGGKSYATYLGGSGEDKALGVALRAGNAIHMVGGTISPNFPNLTPLPSQNVVRNSQDGFVVKSPLLDLKVAVPASAGGLLACLAGLLLGLGLLRLKHEASTDAVARSV